MAAKWCDETPSRSFSIDTDFNQPKSLSDFFFLSSFERQRRNVAKRGDYFKVSLSRNSFATKVALILSITGSSWIIYLWSPLGVSISPVSSDSMIKWIPIKVQFTNYGNCIRSIDSLTTWKRPKLEDNTKREVKIQQKIRNDLNTLRVHVPPFLHGCVAHGCSTISHRSPDSPSVHVQWNLSGSLFSHVPPCKQGSWVPQ